MNGMLKTNIQAATGEEIKIIIPFVHNLTIFP